MDIICNSCEAEFFVDTQEEVKYCVACGTELETEVEDDDWLDEYEEDEWLDDD